MYMDDDWVKLQSSGNYLIKYYPPIRYHTVCEYTRTDPPIHFVRVKQTSKNSVENSEDI